MVINLDNDISVETGETNNMNQYLEQDLSTPKYFFHGSPKLLNEVHAQLSHDSDGKEFNIDNAIFVSPSFLIASAYSFKNTIKEISEGLDWDFEVYHTGDLPVMRMENVRVDDNIEGYVYVFENNGNFVNEPEGSLQYKYYGKLRPTDVVKIRYADYKFCYGEMENTRGEEKKKQHI